MIKATNTGVNSFEIFVTKVKQVFKNYFQAWRVFQRVKQEGDKYQQILELLSAGLQPNSK